MKRERKAEDVTETDRADIVSVTQSSAKERTIGCVSQRWTGSEITQLRACFSQNSVHVLVDNILHYVLSRICIKGEIGSFISLLLEVGCTNM